MTNSDSVAGTAGPEAIRIEYVPRPGLVRLALVNALLSVITLTVYRFWAKTRVRRHLWSCVHINGEPLEYTGRGKELFLGALIVFAIFGLPVALAMAGLSIAYGPEHPAIAGIQVLLFFVVSVLWGAAIFRARRYQLSRTQWRGIRGGLEGSAMTYTLLYFGSLMARGMTLGWSTPVLNFALQEHMTGAMRFGSLPFRFKGRAGPLYPSYAVCWVLTLAAVVIAIIAMGAFIGAMFGTDLTQIFGDLAGDQQQPNPEQAVRLTTTLLALLGLYLLFFAAYPVVWSLYTAREMALFAQFTRAGEAEFAMDVSAGAVIRLIVGNFLITTLSLGVLRPIAQQRLLRFYCDRLQVKGMIDVDAVRQSSLELSRTGEGLADAFDVGGL
jgi:uncharacterized membrane protein YjgN (DUF898 family)